MRALQIDCHFQPVLGEICERGLYLGVRDPFCQFTAPQRAFTAFHWIGGHGGTPPETAIIERYRRRESSVEEALIEMYLAGISVRRVEDITEALWGTRVSPSTVSNLNKLKQVDDARARAQAAM